MELPNFRYNPNALSLGVIIKEKTSCPVCKNERVDENLVELTQVSTISK